MRSSLNASHPLENGPKLQHVESEAGEAVANDGQIDVQVAEVLPDARQRCDCLKMNIVTFDFSNAYQEEAAPIRDDDRAFVHALHHHLNKEFMDPPSQCSTLTLRLRML